ncbi:MAG: A24 family peptidase [Pirellulales bacterium]
MNSFYQLSMAYRLVGLFALGAGIGSVINWAIFQWGLTRRAASPWSAQPAEAPPRRLIDFLPIAGWFFLRRESPLWGRGHWIRPALIDLGTGCMFAGLYWWEVAQLGLYPRDILPPGMPPSLALLDVLHAQFAVHAGLLCLMVMATFIDIDDQIIPDSVTLPGTLLALLLAAVHPWSLLPAGMLRLPSGELQVEFVTLMSPSGWPAWLNAQWDQSPLVIAFLCLWLWCFALLPRRWRGRRGANAAVGLMLARISRDPFSRLVLLIGLVVSVGIVLFWRLGGAHWQGLLSALVGMMVSAGLVWGVRLIAALVLRREAMGFGDVTLMAMIGAALGWQAGLAVFFIAPVVAVFYAVARLLLRGEREIPYGPFLCAGAATVIIAWAPIWERIMLVAADFNMPWWFLPALLVGAAVMLALLLSLLQLIKGLFRPRTAQNEPPATT